MIKHIPENYLSIHNYISRCDYVFNQPFNEINYENNKLSDITDNSTIYCWSSYLNDLFIYLYQNDIKNITLISGCNDHTVNPNGHVIGWPSEPIHNIIPCPKNIIKWYAQNAEIVSDFMTPIPIGPCVLPLKQETMKNFIIDEERDKLLYINLNIKTNPYQRSSIKYLVESQTKNYTSEENVSIKKYCEQLQKHIFCLCVPGNGKDTHRVWESIFFGCIPIVEKSPMNDFFSTMFPMLVVDKWSQIDDAFLITEYDKIKNKIWKYDLLDVDNFFSYFNILKSNKHINFSKLVENNLVFTRNTNKLLSR